MPQELTFSSHRRIQDIKEQWTELDRAAEKTSKKYINHSFYQTYGWNEFLFRHITGGMGKLTAMMVYELVMADGRPFAIIPMHVTRLSKKARIPSCRVAGILGMVCPYDEECTDDIVGRIANHIIKSHKGMKLSFADVPVSSPFARVMGRICSDVKERTSYHVPLTEFHSVDEYIASLHKNIYKNIRKSYNHLKTDGKEMELKVFTHGNMPGNGYMRRLWSLYLHRKMAWRHEKGGLLPGLGLGLKSLYETYCGCAGRSLREIGCAELYVLEIDRRPAAFMIVYRHRNRLLMPKLAIDTAFSRYSPGILLILEASKRWIAEGIEDFDMCRGDERYKKEMGGVNEPLCRIDKRL